MNALRAPWVMIVGWTQLGVDPDAPEHTTKHIVVMNQLAIYFSVVTALIAAGPYMNHWAPIVRITTIVMALGMAPCVLVLNAKKQPLAAAVWMLTLVFGLQVLNARNLPDEAEHVLFFYTACALPPFLITSSRRRLAIGMTVLFTAGTVLALTWQHLDPPVVEADPAFARLVGYSNRLMALVLILAVVFYATRQTHRVEGRLHERNSELADALTSLEEAQTKLVLTQKLASLADLVAGVAHELNTPLGAMKSSAVTADRALAKLRNKPSDRVLDILADTLRVIGEATERVVEVVDMLRSFARLDGADWQIANVDEEVKRTLGFLRHRFGEAVTIVEEYGDTPDIRCRPRQLNQLFANLIVNAVDALEPDGTLTVRTEVHDGHVQVELIDDGEGIAPADLARVFDPGFTTRGVGVGVGLGLAVAYSIATEHGGDLVVESEGTGRGTTVRVTLPG